MISLLEALTVE